MKRRLRPGTHAASPAHASIARFFRFLAAAVIVATLTPPQPALMSASCPPARWEQFQTPNHDGLLILPGSDIDRFCAGGAQGQTLYAIGTRNSPCGIATAEDPFAPDGMLFASGQAPCLWKSTDGGCSWRDRTEAVLEAAHLPDAGDGDYDDFLVFTAVSAAPDDPDTVLVAGYDRNGVAVVVVSLDGAHEFVSLGCNAIDGIILSASISPSVTGRRDIAVGTIDTTAGGKIWRYESGRYWTQSWQDTSQYDGWDETPLWAGDPAHILAVTSIAFSPSYADDNAILAAVIGDAEEPDGDPYSGFYFVAGVWDSAPAWNADAGLSSYPVLIRDAGSVLHAPISLPIFLLRNAAGIALPADYHADMSSHRNVLLYANGSLVHPASDTVQGEGGFLFWVQDATLSGEMLGREDNPWVASTAYSGTSDMRGRILVGTFFPDGWSTGDIAAWFDTGSPAPRCCAGVDVLLSENNDPCCPHWTRAQRPPSGQFNAQVAWSADGEAARAATSGAGRLWHNDDWYADESAFSRSDREADRWEQCGLIDTMIRRLVDVAYDPAAAVLYLHTSHPVGDGTVCSCHSIWRTGDAGDSWTRILHGRPDVNDDDEDEFDDIIDGYYRGFYKPATSGSLQALGVRYIIGDDIDEDDEQQVQAGFQTDAVYRRVDGGTGVWERMSELTLDYQGLLHLSCADAPGAVLYTGFDNLWWDFTENVPLPYQADGSDPDCPPNHECRKTSGAARVLEPNRPGCCHDYEWDYLIRGLRGTSDPDGIYEELTLVGANCGAEAVRLWAIDAGSKYWAENGDDGQSYDWCESEFADPRWGRLWIYDDCYAVTAASLDAGDASFTVPSDPCRCAHEEFELTWDRTCDACAYEVQVALDSDFRHIIVETTTLPLGETLVAPGFYQPPAPTTPSLLIPKGTLDCNQTYWWRVRAHLAETDEVIASWWSEPGVIRTAPGPAGLLELRVPGDGATRVPVKNASFTWTPVSGATKYDFMVVDRERSHVASQVSDSTSFVLPLALDYDTPYIWRVIALDGDRVIAESARATFRTEPAPVTPEYVPTGPTIVPPPVPVQQDWQWYLTGVLGVLLAVALALLSYVNRRTLRRHASRGRPGPRA